MTLAHPIAEGAHGGWWLVAYAAAGGAVDVIAFRRNAHGGLGVTAWAGRLRGAKWLSVIGEPSRGSLDAAAAWVRKECGNG